MNNFFLENFMNGYKMAENGMKQYYDLCVATAENMAAGQKQMESFFQNYMGNPMQQSESAMKTFNDFMAQANANHQHYRNIWTDYMAQMLEYMFRPRFNFFPGLSEK